MRNFRNFISKHFTAKIVVALVAAECVSLIIAVLITFLVIKPNMQEQILEEAAEDGERLAWEIDGILDDMCANIEYFCALPEFIRILEQAETNPDNLIAALNDITAFESMDIRAVCAYTDELGWFYSDGEITERDELFMDSVSMQNLSADNTGPLVGNFYTSIDENDSLNIGMAAVTASGQLWRIVFLFESQDLKETISTALNYNYTGFEIAKVNGPGFFNGGDSSNAHDLLSENTDEGNYIINDNTGFYVITQTGYSWRICGFISSESLGAEYMPSLWSSVLLCLLMFIISLIIILPLTKNLLSPINVLHGTMKKAAEGNLDVRAKIDTKDELHDLGEQFNQMLEQIKIHTDDAIKLEVSEQNLKHSILMSQINYHFIYNAMSTINSLARKKDYEKIIRLNSALAEILHSNMLIEDGKMTCTLRDEIGVAENYWTIEQISRKGSAQLIVECEEELENAVIPKNILQPLVENCVRHGLVDVETGHIKGKVLIQALREDNFLILRVADDGRGIDEETLKLLESGAKADKNRHHIGISNIKKRLSYIYGDAAELEITTGGGTQITIRIPF